MFTIVYESIHKNYDKFIFNITSICLYIILSKIAKKIKTEKGMKEKNKETTKEEQEKSEEMS